MTMPPSSAFALCKVCAPVVQTAATSYPLLTSIFFILFAFSIFGNATITLLTTPHPDNIKFYRDTHRSPTGLPANGTQSSRLLGCDIFFCDMCAQYVLYEFVFFQFFYCCLDVILRQCLDPTVSHALPLPWKIHFHAHLPAARSFHGFHPVRLQGRLQAQDTDWLPDPGCAVPLWWIPLSMPGSGSTDSGSLRTTR